MKNEKGLPARMELRGTAEKVQVNVESPTARNEVARYVYDVFQSKISDGTLKSWNASVSIEPEDHYGPILREVVGDVIARILKEIPDLKPIDAVSLGTQCASYALDNVVQFDKNLTRENVLALLSYVASFRYR